MTGHKCTTPQRLKYKKGFNKQNGLYTENNAAMADVQNWQENTAQIYRQKIFKNPRDQAQEQSLDADIRKRQMSNTKDI